MGSRQIVRRANLIRPDLTSNVFVLGGDSGSIVLESFTNGPVALIFAGYIGGALHGWRIANSWVLNIKPYFALDEVA